MDMNTVLDNIYKMVEKMDGWLSFSEGSFLYQAARSCCGRGVVVEIGSWKGKSAIWLANGLRDGKGGVVYAIDPHTGAPEHHEIFQTKDIWTFDEFKKNIKTAGVENMVSPIVERSENVAKTWDKPIELLWIDGAHSYEAATLDFESWFPHLIEGGILAYHDSTYDDVRRVMREKVFFSRNFRSIGFADSITYATKIDPSRQTFADRFSNYCLYAISSLYSLRRFPIPPFLRKPAKRLFKNFANSVSR